MPGATGPRLTPRRLAALLAAAADSEGGIPTADLTPRDEEALEQLGYAASIDDCGHVNSDPGDTSLGEHRSHPHFFRITAAGRAAAEGAVAAREMGSRQPSQGPASSGGRASRDPGDLAASALIAASTGDHLGAARAIRALADAGELTRAMCQWVDTLVEQSRRHGFPVPGAPPRASVPADRQTAPAHGQEPDADPWAEQFIAGRAALSHGTCNRLLAEIPDSQAGRYARGLVRAVSARMAMIPVTGREPWE
jgi:hypothetical protein